MKSVLLVILILELLLQFVTVTMDFMKIIPNIVHHVLINVKSVTIIQIIVSLVLEIELLHQNVISQNKLLNQLLLKMLLLVLLNQSFVLINVQLVKEPKLTV
jgi:hypothetical protein